MRHSFRWKRVAGVWRLPIFGAGASLSMPMHDAATCRHRSGLLQRLEGAE